MQDVPEKIWMTYNCNIGLLDILKLYWNDLDHLLLLRCLVVFHKDLPFINYSVIEALQGHKQYLWIIQEKYEFIKKVRQEHENSYVDNT